MQGGNTLTLFEINFPKPAISQEGDTKPKKQNEKTDYETAGSEHAGR
jgi:hypothetical protein